MYTAREGLRPSNGRDDRRERTRSRVRPFSKFLKHNPVLIDFSELSTRISSFLNLDNVYLCL